MKNIFLIIFTLIGFIALAQQNQKPLTRLKALEIAQQKNPEVQLANIKKEKQEALMGSAFAIESPEIIFEAPTSNELRPGVLQSFNFPTTYIRQYQAQKQQVGMAETHKQITLNELRYRVNTVYNEIQYWGEVYASYLQQDTLLEDFAEVTSVRLQVGQISNLEKLNAESQYREIKYQLGQVLSKLRTARMQMGLLIGTPGDSSIRAVDEFTKLNSLILETQSLTEFGKNPLTKLYEQNQKLQQTTLKLQRNTWVPNLIVGYLNQGASNSEVKYRMRYGFTFPLWFWGNVSKVKAAKKEVNIATQQMVLNNYALQGNYNQALSELKQYSEALNYYEQTGLPQAEEIARTAKEGYRLGIIGYYNYIINLQQVIKIRLGYLEALKNYNQAIFTIQFLKGE
jgi:cobalt-zinc-cadmium resistance protein CzcA